MKTVRNSASSHSRNKFRGMSWSNVYCRGPLCKKRGNVDSQGNRAGRLPVVAENSRCWPNIFINEIYNGMTVALW